RKACRNRPLTEAQTKRNRYLSKTAMCLNLLKAANRLSAPAAAQKATGCLIIGYPGRIKGVFG
ncbi:IS5/IS1182 family transposase, partial [Neisseria meningitidis]